jgi:hypothetical protein
MVMEEPVRDKPNDEDQIDYIDDNQVEFNEELQDWEEWNDWDEWDEYYHDRRMMEEEGTAKGSLFSTLVFIFFFIIFIVMFIIHQ